MSLIDRRAAKALRRTPSYLLLSVIALLFIGPILWMLSGSLKSINEILRYPPTILPEVFHWENYLQVFTLQPFGRQLFNSVLLMVLVCALTLLVAIPAGYALARVRPAGAAVIFVVLLSGIFIPPEFEEAAILDGANRWRTMTQIFLPLVRPSIASAIVFTAGFPWNQFLEPLVYLRSPENLTGSVSITLFEDPLAGPRWNVQMAATTLSVLPVLIVFLIAQRHVVSGLTAGGLKS
jgi:multiple sugar transport system permease protein